MISAKNNSGSHDELGQKNLPGSRTEIVDNPTETNPSDNSIFPHESEFIVKSLKSYTVEEIGGSSFLRMYGNDLERLSIQAHTSARQRDDEYIIDSILTWRKLGVLVKTLLSIEAWRNFVLLPAGNVAYKNIDWNRTGDNKDDYLLPLLAKNRNSLRCAFILHAETTIVGLLNLILYRKESCEEMENDTSIALVDYCARQIATLATPIASNEMIRLQKEPLTANQLTQRLHTRSAVDEIHENLLGTMFKTAVSVTTLARYLCEHFDYLPLGTQSRILDTHDFLLMMIPLIEEPPWTRRCEKPLPANRKFDTSSGRTTMQWEKLMENFEWKVVQPANLLEITQFEAQCWLAVFHLTCNDTCRRKYGLDTYRKDNLLRLRKYLNRVMLDQLPVLEDVMKYMDEFSLMSVPEGGSGSGSALMMQQVDSLRLELLQGQDWKALAKKQYSDIFSNVTDGDDEDLQHIAGIYGKDEISDSVLANNGSSPSEYTNKSLVDIDLLILDNRNDGTGNILYRFKLTPVENEQYSMTESENGLFRRQKLKICAISDESSNKFNMHGNKIIFPSKTKVVSNITFDESNQNKRFQLEFRAIDMEKDLSSKSVTVWRQLGTLKEELVVQIGFQRFTNTSSDEISYSLDKVFLSQKV